MRAIDYEIEGYFLNQKDCLKAYMKKKNEFIYKGNIKNYHPDGLGLMIQNNQGLKVQFQGNFKIGKKNGNFIVSNLEKNKITSSKFVLYEMDKEI